MDTINLPTEVKALATFVLTAGVKDLLTLFGLKLHGKATALVAAVVAAAIASLEAFLNALPADLKPVVMAGLELVTTLLAAYGAHNVLSSVLPSKPG